MRAMYLTGELSISFTLSSRSAGYAAFLGIHKGGKEVYQQLRLTFNKLQTFFASSCTIKTLTTRLFKSLSIIYKHHLKVVAPGKRSITYFIKLQRNISRTKTFSRWSMYARDTPISINLSFTSTRMLNTTTKNPHQNFNCRKRYYHIPSKL